MCALSTQRITSGASTAPTFVTNALSHAPQVYFEDALVAVSGNHDHQDLRNLEALQAVQLLCVSAMETGQVSLYHQLMGLYHTVVADQGLADERRWPIGLSRVEMEQRRRLFWHMYRLEVHTSLIMGHMMRCPEQQTTVEYPDAACDASEKETEWILGWNFVTDLYRGLEHLLIHFRSRRHRESDSANIARLVAPWMLSEDAKARLLAHLNAKYEALPRRFKDANRMSPNVERNRCVYQAANIICTYQLLKMLSYASGNIAFHDACRTVLALVEGISTIPIDFVRSMSVAMVQELSGFGHLLSSFIGKDLSAADYQHLKMVLLCMSELLECLASSIPAAEEATERVKQYVRRIEDLQTPAVESLANKNPSGPEDTSCSTAELIFKLDFFDQMPWCGWFPEALDQQ